MTAVDEETQRHEFDELYERMRDALEEPPPEAWIGSEDDPVFIGYLRTGETRVSQYGTTVVLTFAELRTGEVRTVWLYHAVLRSELARLAPQPGELVAIRWLGKSSEERGDTTYVQYRVKVDRPDQGGAIDWTTIGATVTGEEGTWDQDADDIPF